MFFEWCSPGMRLVVTSATLDGEKFSAYFDDCPVMSIPGRCFPVDVVHSVSDHDKDYLHAAVDTALVIHMDEPEGAAMLSP
jgi:ATP-dependent RNA helicase DHX8/PRP22